MYLTAVFSCCFHFRLVRASFLMSLFYLVIYSFDQSIYISVSFVENFSSDPEEDKENRRTVMM